MLFPCRPEQAERMVVLAGTPVRMRLASCAASSATFSLAMLDAGSPERAGPLLDRLQARAAANVAGAATVLPTVAPCPAGAPGNARHVRIEGKLPDGRAVVEEACFFFGRGAQVYQATVLGTAQRQGSEPAETFFGSIRLP